MPNGQYLRYGLCPGSYDFIGILARKITQDMVGDTIGQFVAIEIKAEGGGLVSPEQKVFGSLIEKFHGKSIVTSNGIELLDLLST